MRCNVKDCDKLFVLLLRGLNEFCFDLGSAGVISTLYSNALVSCSLLNPPSEPRALDDHSVGVLFLNEQCSCFELHACNIDAACLFSK
jgi:hypothetical protein